jgi:hypothetical protein
MPSVISGKLYDPDGKPVAMARVYFSRGPGNLPDVAAVTDDGGGFALSAPSPGTYEIASTADGFATVKKMVDVRPGQSVQLELRLQRARGAAR